MANSATKRKSATTGIVETKKSGSAGDARHTAGKPPGWYFKCDAPSDLAGLADWLAPRTAWLHEFLAGRFSAEFGDAILRELPWWSETDKTPPIERVFRYVRGVVAHVHCWLDHHQVYGQPEWFYRGELEQETLAADFHLSAVLSSIRNLLYSTANGDKMPDADPAEQLKPLTKKQAAVLRFLNKQAGVLCTLESIESVARPPLAHATVSSVVKELIAAGYAVRPTRSGRGVTVTSAGKAVADSLPASDDN